MRYGELTQTAWQRFVRKELHTTRKDILLGPSPWERCSGFCAEQHECFFWAEGHASGVSADIGYYAILKAAGELAAKGVCPAGVSVRILFPPDASEDSLKAIAKRIEDACGRLGIQVTSFQGETTAAAAYTTVFATVGGRADERRGLFCADRHIKELPEQEIIHCGYAGLEGTLRILDEAGDELGTRFVSSFLSQAKALRKDLVMPKQILKIMDSGNSGRNGITAIRQIGSGGVLAALWELSEMLHTGFEIDLSCIELKQETVEICEFYRLNPYQMTSSGSFLIVTPDAQTVLDVLEKEGVRAGRLGITRAQNARVITSGEETRYLDRPAPDELTSWLAEHIRA